MKTRQLARKTFFLAAWLLLGNAVAAQSPPPTAPPTRPVPPTPEAVAPLEESGGVASEQPTGPRTQTPAEPAPLTPSQVSSPTGQVRATPAVTRSRRPGLQGGFTVRLARAPKMMGDFFGTGYAPVSGQALVGQAVHQILGSTASGVNELRFISDASDPPAVYTNSYLSPTITPPAGTTITGLTSPYSHDSTFTAIDSGDVVDVYEDASSMLPDLTGAAVYDVYEHFHLYLPASGPGDLLGRTRLQDNNSAMPQDRVYFDYSYFHNAALTAGGVDVNRFAPGVEKTFLNGMGSVELRVPFGMTINSNLVSGGPIDTSNFEFGNLVVAPKLLLSSDRDLAIAVGMGVALPTADDVVLLSSDKTQVLRVVNNAVHLLPYLAFLYAPECSDAFAHLFVTFDFDTNGNRVSADLGNPSLTSLGRWYDQHLVTVNASYGRWIYRSDCPSDRLQGVAFSTELHYTGSISDADSVSGGSFVVGDETADISLLNATVGGHVRMGKTTFTAGYAVPLTSADRVFDGELRLIANRAF